MRIAALLLVITSLLRWVPAAATASTASLAVRPLRDVARTRLARLEDDAEAIAEGEVRGHAASVAAARIAARWPALQDDLRRLGAPPSALRAADESVRSLRPSLGGTAMMRAGNDLSGALVPFFAPSGDPIPAALHTLDYLARSIRLDAQTGDWRRASRDLARLQATWSSFRDAAVRHRAGVEAARFDATLRRAQRAIERGSRDGAIEASRSFADGVDAMERRFP